MRTDPIPLIVSYLNSCPDVPAGTATGSLLGRESGDTTVYVTQTGGFRLVRDSVDRADVMYEVYHRERPTAAGLAFTVREYLLEHLPGLLVEGVQVLDTKDISAPHYVPDTQSSEHTYEGEIAIFYA